MNEKRRDVALRIMDRGRVHGATPWKSKNCRELRENGVKASHTAEIICKRGRADEMGMSQEWACAM